MPFLMLTNGTLLKSGVILNPDVIYDIFHDHVFVFFTDSVLTKCTDVLKLLLSYFCPPVNPTLQAQFNLSMSKTQCMAMVS